MSRRLLCVGPVDHVRGPGHDVNQVHRSPTTPTSEALYAAAIAFLRAAADAGDRSARVQLAGLLAARVAQDTLAELRTRADAGDRSAPRAADVGVVSTRRTSTPAVHATWTGASDRLLQKVVDALLSRLRPRCSLMD